MVIVRDLVGLKSQAVDSPAACAPVEGGIFPASSSNFRANSPHLPLWIGLQAIGMRSSMFLNIT